MGAGPPLRILATYPAAGAGSECGPTDSAECGVSTRVALELRFDRYLLPSTAVRQSIRLTSGPRAPEFLIPEYDLVERVVVYRLPEGVELAPGTLYTVEVRAPEGDGWGFRAFDGAPLEEGPVPLEFHFTTARASSTVDTAPPREVPDCAAIATFLDRGGCGSAGCHSGESPSMGLALDSVDALLSTAVGRIARETETGTEVGTPLRDPARFGVRMPRIEPGAPANSYLLYKVLLDPENYPLEGDAIGDCSSRYNVDWGGPCPDPAPGELERFQSWFVLGQAMPRRNEEGESVGALDRDALHDLADWIAAGASCP